MYINGRQDYWQKQISPGGLSVGIQDALYTTLCDKVCQWLVADRLFSPDTPVSSTNKIDSHDITESGVKHHKPNPL
jgi:hypothetical protein